MKGMIKTCTYRKQLLTLYCTLLSFTFLYGQNVIVQENLLTGNPQSEWDIPDGSAGDLSIQGFATDISVNKGGTIRFKIKTDAAAYSIDIYRLGYYNGNGARKIGTGTITTALPQIQPNPIQDVNTGLVDCGNWNESARWNVPANAVSGVYIAKLKRTDNGGVSHIIFIVRDDNSHSDLFFQTSDATWQAYNGYGGGSLYVGNTTYPNGHAVKVSYNRPYISRNGGWGGGPQDDWIFNAEYPMIRFLEKNGYDVTYTTNVDAARRGNLILNHKVFLSVGHDEYWSAEQRTNVEAARNAGIHLAFFSGNEVYWKTRWENSVDGSNTSYRTLVCYKEGTLGEIVCGGKCDPSPQWTGLWRDGCSFASSGGCLPENALTGQISWDQAVGAINVPAVYKNLRFWRNTTITTLTNESEATFPFGTLGFEWNWEQYPNTYPSGRITLSSTNLNGHTHKLSLYRHSSGALVFGAGTVQWSWGLDDKHDRGNLPPDIRMQQATINLFADMGVQPLTLQGGLIAAFPSTDHSAPQTTILNPSNGNSVEKGTRITFSGTSSDIGGGVLAGIEISVDGGATWKLVNGTSTWTYTWTPLTLGTVIIKVRGYDDSGNMEATNVVPSSNAITLNIIEPQPPVCPCTLFELTDAPAQGETNLRDNSSGIELGIKIRSALNGYITGIRFYKGTNDAGTHVGSLWTNNGNLLGRATFTNESAFGWQQVNFDQPIPINANTVYTASYFSPQGFYSETNPYFDNDFLNYPLTAISTTDPTGPNSVYVFTTSPSFPTSGYSSSNKWVDVVFNTNLNSDVTPPTVIATEPASLATQVSINSQINISFNELIDVASVNSSTIELKSSNNSIIPGSVSVAQNNIIFTPYYPLSYSNAYTVKIKGGLNGVKDEAGNALANDYIWSFITADPPPPPPAEGFEGPILVISSTANAFSRYTVEILRAEGFNEFTAKDILQITPSELNNYDVIVLGEISVNATQANMLANWVNAGGTLIAFKPSEQLAGLLGITKIEGSISDKYLLINTASGPGSGIVNETIQFHSSADLYALNGATGIAMLYSNATTSTQYPAITTKDVGLNGGKAIAFTYDLAKSIVYTRQGNPAWIGQKRDGQTGPIRSDDMFVGGGGIPDWVDFNKIPIPQADEQQRLLTNIILQSNLHRKPLPRFWFLPRNLKAAVIMTGDDHALNGTEGRFNQYLTLGPNTPQDVADWKAIRGTSYIFPYTPISQAQANAFQTQGFEIALHVNTNCGNFTPSSYQSTITQQLADFNGNFPALFSPVTNRNHCVAWSDWSTVAKTQVQHGIRLDVNYYYWPESWTLNRPGLFTGSGMPMRFADVDGSLIDCYQVTTQMTDETRMPYESFSRQLFDKAIGPEGYYGVFCANMHTDTANHVGSNIIIANALERGIPVISAKQLLTWLDGRNNSYFSSITWNNNRLNFSISATSGAYNLTAMLPLNSQTNQITSITRDGTINVPFTIETIKGIQYAIFGAITGNYVAVYESSFTGTLNGKIALQGRGIAPNLSWQVPLKVDIYAAGNTTAPLYTYDITTDKNGNFTINNIPPGTYTIAVKNLHTLKRVVHNYDFSIGNHSIDFGILLEGDMNNDNIVDPLDASLLLNSFYKGIGDAGYDSRADLNGDNFVDPLDASLLLNNFYRQGETP